MIKYLREFEEKLEENNKIEKKNLYGKEFSNGFLF